MEYWNKLWKKEETPPSFMDDISNELQLSYTKRITFFVIFLCVGIAFCFMSTMMILSPTSFAKFYTLGTVSIIASTFFLVGPKKQIASMFHSSRLASALIYIFSILATLYCALSLHSALLTMVLMVVQFGAAVWYGASYVPMAQNCLRSTAKTILPL